MKWYNPWSWFEKIDSSSDIFLYCDNPQCGKPINFSVLLYSKQEKEVYPDSGCAFLANAHKTMKSKKISYNRVESISKNKALKLLRKGKLKQASLEEKVE